MICFPRPKTYRLIRGNSYEIKFDRVKNGNAASDGYVITFQDGETSSGTLDLKFTTVKTDDVTQFLFIIDNGISPELNYSFSIEKDQIDIVSNVVKVIVAANVSVFVLWILCVMCYWKGKALKWSPNHRRDASHLEIALSHQAVTNIEVVEDDQQTNMSREPNLKENSLYEDIDQHQVDGTYNYNIFAEQSAEIGNHYITLIEEEEAECLVEKSTKAKDIYKTVIKNLLSDPNKYITPVYELNLRENSGNSVIDSLPTDKDDYLLPLNNTPIKVLYYINPIEIAAAENTEYITPLDELSSNQKYYIKAIGESSA